MRVLTWLLGGRPMTLVLPRYFTDSVAGKPVNIYRDTYGRYWMAFTRWSLFRVFVENGEMTVEIAYSLGIAPRPEPAGDDGAHVIWNP